MTTRASGRARIAWCALGTMRLRLNLRPSETGTPVPDMTQVSGVSISVLHQDGTSATWTASVIGVVTSDLLVVGHVFVDGDLTAPETIECTALLTTPSGVFPSDKFFLEVDT